MRREQIRLPEDETIGASNSPRITAKDGQSGFQMEPDGVIIFRTKRSRDIKAVVEVRISQTYAHLLEKARKCVFGKKCNIVILLAFDERRPYERPNRHICLATSEETRWIEQMRLDWHSQRHVWLDQLREGFIEVVRINPSPDERDSLLKRRYVLLNEGRNESSSVTRSVGDIRMGELIPRESLNNIAASEVIIDFFDAEDL
ncbi:hypothetical protein V1525DRAFT_423456 [Lipomyces kononenkoae]|uniref:Uncharacterized protein n=1 Tax=Lipomyces kononenkoae TaxID=34357 RepID=A0ACC3TAP1_LIPKO